MSRGLILKIVNELHLKENETNVVDYRIRWEEE